MLSKMFCFRENKFREILILIAANSQKINFKDFNSRKNIFIKVSGCIRMPN